MVKYKNSYFNVFIQENDIKESILMENPVFERVKKDGWVYSSTSENIEKRNLNNWEICHHS